MTIHPPERKVCHGPDTEEHDFPKSQRDIRKLVQLFRLPAEALKTPIVSAHRGLCLNGIAENVGN
jgi:hypothetical protein